ncbi:ribonuclease P protein component [Azohydromonas caseinilytica]|uniref:Ribonuclease P protein component n=1 Tax=Azohydromonas caseinilytica TaxID=2728836 RepID=A0A848FIE9_9BURK|nr:ribonuclease P protein component [Azohydromonas caseinilytica]NML18655.1 ribonuclease P protein component [Azohydromonas caseinilytica]
MIGRLTSAADFQRALQTRQLSRSPHFAAHHLRQRPGAPAQLSTAPAEPTGAPVDDPVCGWWLGLVVPKRHARRAVTRTLIKRQMREALRRHQQHLPPGQWVLRLRAPIDPKQFPSAASDALRVAVRTELDKLLGRITP